MSARLLGVVAWFDRLRGFGFITPAGSNKDVFCHYSAIQGDGYRNLEQGETVEFELGLRQGRTVATNVQVLTASETGGSNGQKE
jgi:cold shock protein